MNYETLREDLKALSVPEIEQLRDDYQRAHPKEGKCVYLCNEVIKDKQEKESTADFERMLKDALAKKNAPDGAGTPSQGNETREQAKDRIHLYCSRFRQKGKE